MNITPKQHILTLLLALPLFLVGCAATHSTRLQINDFTEVSTEIAADLAASPFLRNRTPQSLPINITFEKITNLSSDIISASAQWTIMQRIFTAFPVQALSQQANINIILPAAKTLRTRNSSINSEANSDFGSKRTVTHIMTATIDSLTRTSDQHRTDLYAFTFQITDLSQSTDKNGILIWSDKYEIKRAAVGNIRD